MSPVEQHRIRQAEQRIEDQKRRLQTLIVQGHPTQRVEDMLAEMYRTLAELHPREPRRRP